MIKNINNNTIENSTSLLECFPYTNYHNLNLDYILKHLKELENFIINELPPLITDETRKYLNKAMFNALYNGEKEQIIFFVDKKIENPEIEYKDTTLIITDNDFNVEVCE